MLSQGNDDSVSQNSFCFCLAVYFKQNFLNKRATADPPTDTLIRLAELVLNKNTFSFRDEVFSQMSGVAMGTKMGPSYACLFMGHLEHNQLLDFINFVQNFHPAVKFTYEISEKSVTFLDMKLVLKEEKLTTSVHYKSTDSHSYLDYRSSHNPSTKKSIPFSQFLRLRRLCLDDADFEEKAEEMANFFLQGRYPENHGQKSSRLSQTHSPTKNTAAQQQNGRRREIDHESPLPPFDYSRAQNHLVQLEFPAGPH